MFYIYSERSADGKLTALVIFYVKCSSTPGRHLDMNLICARRLFDMRQI
jgi:hypothetical protein